MTGLLSGKITELSAEEEDILEKNLVWIFASPRSGTSWLGIQLLSYNTFTMDEPYIGEHLCIPKVSAGVISRKFDHHQKRKSTPEHYFFSEKYADTWKHFTRKLILNRIHSQFHDLSKNIIIKEPHGSLAADIISECLPNSKIIILFRDGRDVIDSHVDGNSEGGWIVKSGGKALSSEKRRINFIRQHAYDWVKLIEVLTKLSQTHNKKLQINISYEDLRKNTLQVLERLYQFIGIKIDKDKLEEIVSNYKFENIPQEKRGRQFSTRFATPGKWKENFNDNEIRVIDEIIGPTLKKLNYS